MELMEALHATDVNSDMIGACEEVYYTTADLKEVSYLDDCEGGTVDFRTYVDQRARVEVYYRNDTVPDTETFGPHDAHGDLVGAIRDYVQELGTTPKEEPVGEIRVTFEWVGTVLSSTVYDKDGAEVTSDDDYFSEQVEWDSPTFTGDLYTIGHTDTLETYFDDLQGEAEREVSARFVNILNRYYA